MWVLAILSNWLSVHQRASKHKESNHIFAGCCCAFYLARLSSCLLFGGRWAWCFHVLQLRKWQSRTSCVYPMNRIWIKSYLCANMNKQQWKRQNQHGKMYAGQVLKLGQQTCSYRLKTESSDKVRQSEPQLELLIDNSVCTWTMCHGSHQ